MEFYKKVNALCREKGISITTLASELGFSKATPTNWKKMKKPPRAENAKKIAEYFNVSVSELTGNENIKIKNIKNNNGIIGNTHAPVTINGPECNKLGDIEKELLNICTKLDIKRKNALLTKAYELLEN